MIKKPLQKNEPPSMFSECLTSPHAFGGFVSEARRRKHTRRLILLLMKSKHKQRDSFLTTVSTQTKRLILYHSKNTNKEAHSLTSFLNNFLIADITVGLLKTEFSSAPTNMIYIQKYNHSIHNTIAVKLPYV